MNNKKYKSTYSEYKHRKNHLQSTMSPENIQKLNQKQKLNHRPPFFPPTYMYPFISKTNTFSQQSKSKMLQANSFHKRFSPTGSSVRVNQNPPQLQQEQQMTSKGEQLKTTGYMLKKYSKKPVLQHWNKKAHLQQDNETNQQNRQDEEMSDYNSECISASVQPNQDTSAKDNSISQHEDHNNNEGFINFFPKQIEYYYNQDQQEKAINEYRDIMKSIMVKGYGLKFFNLYVKQNNVNLNPDLFFEHNQSKYRYKPRYYRQVYYVMRKLIHSMQYFLEKDCSLNIRRMKLEEYRYIQKDLLNYKLQCSRKHVRTIEKLLKIILNMQDVTLSERQVVALHAYLMEKIDKKYTPSQSIKIRDTYLTDKQLDPPFTMRRDRKYTKIYKNAQNTFESIWEHEIQNIFLANYTQNSSFEYCSEKLRLIYPQYKNLLTVNHLKMHLQIIFRRAIGKFKSYIQRLESKKGNNLPKLSPIVSSVFKMIITMKHYQKVRFVLTRLYNQGLNQQNCAFFIQKMNEAIRQFQAFQGLAIIRKQQYTQTFETNVISLRPRVKRKYELLKELQQSQNQQNQEKDKSVQQIQQNKHTIQIQQSVMQHDESVLQLNYKDFYYEDG